MSDDKDYNLKKSKLVHQQQQELKTLEKELKKLKGVRKEPVVKKLDDTKTRHNVELEELAKEFGKNLVISAHEAEATESGEEYVYPERDWQGLSKSDLERECEWRKLSKKGSKEELVSRLMMFHNTQRSRIVKGELDPEKKAPHKTAVSIRDQAASRGFYKDAKPTPVAKTEDDKVEKKKIEDNEDSSSDDDEDKEEVDDEEKWEAAGGQGEVYVSRARGRGRGHGKTFRRGGRGRGRGGGGGASRDAEPTEEQRQEKRRVVMEGALQRLMKKFPKGFLIDDLPERLKEINVNGFRPELLGFSSVEEWLESVSKQILRFDASSGRIIPWVVGKMPSDDEEESDNDEEE